MGIALIPAREPRLLQGAYAPSTPLTPSLQEPLSFHRRSGFQGDSGLRCSIWQSGYAMTKLTRGVLAALRRESPKAETGFWASHHP